MRCIDAYLNDITIKEIASIGQLVSKYIITRKVQRIKSTYFMHDLTAKSYHIPFSLFTWGIVKNLNEK